MGVADRLLLDVANRRRLGADLTRAVVAVERTGSMESKPGVVVTVDDPRDRLMRSAVLTRPAIRAVGTPVGHALRPIDLLLDGVWYRLMDAEREGDSVGLTFDHRGAVYMTEHDDPLSASRSDTTRAEFIRRQVLEVARMRGAGHRLAFWAWELHRRMPIAAPTDDLSSRAEPDRDPSSLHDAAKQAKGLTIKGKAALYEQRRNMATGASVADAEQAGPKATLALFVAGIGESDFEDVPNAEGSPYEGVWQGRKDRHLSTAQQARYFLRGGQGFQAGGAIELARRNPGISPGEIATRVEAGGKPASFYDAHRAEAERAIDALGGVATTPGGGGSYVKAFRFRRPRGEDGWENTGKLAEEVGRRRFITIPRRGSDLFVYAADEDLLRLRSQAVIDPDGAYVHAFDYDLDYGKTVRVARVQLLGELFDADLAWGLPVTVDYDGPAAGKWLVWDVREVDGSPLVEAELRMPQTEKPEPASERVQRSDGSEVGDGSATGRVVARAKAIGSRNLPYVWGGGHAVAGRPSGSPAGFDCSGYVAACLLAGGMLPDEWKKGVPASGTFASSWGEAGEGERLTLWANAGHVFLEVKVEGSKVHYIDTSRQAGGGPGPHVRHGKRSTAGFTPRHWPGT